MEHMGREEEEDSVMTGQGKVRKSKGKRPNKKSEGTFGYFWVPDFGKKRKRDTRTFEDPPSSKALWRAGEKDRWVGTADNRR